MFWLNQPPRVIETRVFSRVPEELRLRRPSAWGNANKGGAIVDCFIEGPVFDATGNLYLVDIPHGRIFRVSPAGAWETVAEYDGEPNGLCFHPDGRLLVADYKRGILAVDTASGAISEVLSRRNSEGLKGCNDLIVSSRGDIYFTDQGQTGLHDPTGRVFRLCADGRLDCLISNGPSPNGLVLDRNESVLFVAMTRDNSVWRAPLTSSGVAKVGRFCSFGGTSGPDGLALDAAGNLLVAHASLAHVFMLAPNGELIARLPSAAGTTCTNIAFGGAERRTLYITESLTGTVLMADLPNPGA